MRRCTRPAHTAPGRPPAFRCSTECSRRRPAAHPAASVWVGCCPWASCSGSVHPGRPVFRPYPSCRTGSHSSCRRCNGGGTPADTSHRSAPGWRPGRRRTQSRRPYPGTSPVPVHPAIVHPGRPARPASRCKRRRSRCRRHRGASPPARTQPGPPWPAGRTPRSGRRPSGSGSRSRWGWRRGRPSCPGRSSRSGRTPCCS